MTSFASRAARLVPVFLLPLALAACSGTGSKPPEGRLTISLTSPEFAANGAIPAIRTCNGADLSPPLRWSGVPAEAKSLALIVDDPDAPGGTWVHWVLYDIPPGVEDMGDGAGGGVVPPGTKPGRNGWKTTGYRGPCPPGGRHRYVHKLYALDVVLGDLHEPTKAELERAMQGHVLARGELVGTYQRIR